MGNQRTVSLQSQASRLNCLNRDQYLTLLKYSNQRLQLCQDCEFVVQVLRVSGCEQLGICSQNYWIELQLQRLKKLSQLTFLDQQNTLRLLYQTILGFQTIFLKHKIRFQATSDMICVGEDQAARVWIHSDFNLPYPEFSLKNMKNAELYSIGSVIQSFANAVWYTGHSNLANSIRVSSFKEARQAVLQKQSDLRKFRPHQRQLQQYKQLVFKLRCDRFLSQQDLWRQQDSLARPSDNQSWTFGSSKIRVLQDND